MDEFGPAELWQNYLVAPK